MVDSVFIVAEYVGTTNKCKHLCVENTTKFAIIQLYLSRFELNNLWISISILFYQLSANYRRLYMTTISMLTCKIEWIVKYNDYEQLKYKSILFLFLSFYLYALV